MQGDSVTRPAPCRDAYARACIRERQLHGADALANLIGCCLTGSRASPHGKLSRDVKCSASVGTLMFRSPSISVLFRRCSCCGPFPRPSCPLTFTKDAVATQPSSGSSKMSTDKMVVIPSLGAGPLRTYGSLSFQSTGSTHSQNVK